MQRLLLITFLAGCSSTESDNNRPDAASQPDFAADVSVEPLPDLGTGDVDSGGDARDLAVADTSISMNSLMVETGDGVQVTFEHARYGLTPPSMSGSGEWEIYVEAYRGGADGCPSQDSPTPDQTAIMSGIPVDETVVAVGEAEGFSVVLLDFEGLITTEPVLRAMTEHADLSDRRVCTDCLGSNDPNGLVVFELSAPFDDGQMTGTVRATHCASLDTSM